MITFIPRAVVFKDGKCVAAGIRSDLYREKEGYTHKVMSFPTDHYDFLGFVHPCGMTEAEILAACQQYK